MTAASSTQQFVESEAFNAGINAARDFHWGVPVTLKMRMGWDHASLNAPELARIADGEILTDKIREKEHLTAELTGIAQQKGIKLAADEIDDVLTYALFPQIGLKFLENRGNPAAFEPAPTGKESAPRIVLCTTAGMVWLRFISIFRFYFIMILL